MDLSIATTDDIIRELMERPMRFVFMGMEDTNSPRPKLICAAGKVAHRDQFDELVDRTREWFETASEPPSEPDAAEGGGSRWSCVDDAAALGEDTFSVLGDEGMVLVSQTAVGELSSMLARLGLAHVSCFRIRPTEDGAELAIDQQQAGDVLLEHDGVVLLAMDPDSVRRCNGRVLHFDTSEDRFVWVRLADDE